MDLAWIWDCAKTLPGAERFYKPEWGADLLRIDGKMFALIGGDKNKKPVLSIKAQPQTGELLRTQWLGKIIPGYYLNKQHWNSIYLESDVPQTLIKELLETSYRLVLASLPKRRQTEILRQNKDKK